MPTDIMLVPSDDFIKGMEAERDAAVAYLKAEVKRMHDKDGSRDVLDALCSVIAVIKYGHHWLK
jgi:hypothetical protein